MNHSHIWRKVALFAALGAAGLASSLALAQQSTPAGVAPPPPELETLEEGAPPAVTIKKQGDTDTNGNSVTERKDHGQTTEVQVHSGPSTYYLKPQQVGTSLPGDVQSGPPTSAQWVIKEFDWGGSKATNSNTDK